MPCKMGLTGATGVLGRTLIALAPHIEWLPFKGDLKSFEETERWIQECSADGVTAIIHLAALVPTHVIDQSPQLGVEVNVIGTCHLISAIANAKTKTDFNPWVFMASTSHVYASSQHPLNEDSPLSPISAYGLTKLQGEQWAERLAAKVRLKLCIGRIFSYSSPLQANSYFLPSMIQKLSSAPKNSCLQIPGLSGKRDFWSAQDVATSILYLEQQRAEGTFNVASGHSMYLSEIVTRLQNLLSRQDLVIEETKESAGPPVHLIADVSKLRALGFEPLPVDLEGLVQQIIDTTSTSPKIK